MQPLNTRAAVNVIEQVFVFSMGILLMFSAYFLFEQVYSSFEQHKAIAIAEEFAGQTALATADLYLTAHAGKNILINRTVRFARLDRSYALQLSGGHAIAESGEILAEHMIPVPATSFGKAYSNGALFFSYSKGGNISLEQG